MNVLMVVTWYSPYDADTMTAGVFHYEQAIALKKYCNTALYFPYDTQIESGYMKNVENGLLTFRRRKYQKNFLFNYFNMFNDFLKIRKEFKPDIIHAHVGSQAGKISVILGKLFRIPVVITEHNPIELLDLDKPFMRIQTHFAYHNSQANICVSNDSKNRLENFFEKEKFSVIYNGIIDPQSITKESNEYAKKGYINCSIVAAFYSKEIKGYQYLLPAIKILVEKKIPILLHICGGGIYFDYYVKMAKDLGIEKNCVFYGQCDRERVYSILEQMDFSISASIFECSGVSVQEAMLLGKPLIVTRSGGANSLVTDETAIVVERESVEALVDGITTMIERYTMFDSARIRDYAYKNFEIDKVSKQYISLYKKVIKEYKKR